MDGLLFLLSRTTTADELYAVMSSYAGGISPVSSFLERYSIVNTGRDSIPARISQEIKYVDVPQRRDRSRDPTRDPVPTEGQGLEFREAYEIHWDFTEKLVVSRFEVPGR